MSEEPPNPTFAKDSCNITSFRARKIVYWLVLVALIASIVGCTTASEIEATVAPTRIDETTSVPLESHSTESPDVVVTPTNSIESPQSQLEEIILDMDNDQNVGYIDSLDKIDSSLQSLLVNYLLGKDISTIAVQQDISLSDNKEVLVDIYVQDNPQNVIGDYQSANMNILVIDDAFNIIEGWLPVSSVLDVAILEYTKAIIPVVGFGTDK